jgi:ABC-type uncharacterized transport system substrate-binding protein
MSSFRLNTVAALLVACGLFGGTPQAVDAHPHVWIHALVTLVVDRGRITAARVAWTFDEFYSTTLLRAFDTDRDQSFSDSEVRRLRAEAFEGVKGLGYFTHITIDGKKVPVQRVEDFSAAVRKGRVVYRFAVPLSTPIDPIKNRVTVSVFDESYYVAIAFSQVEIRHEGSQVTACRVDMQEDRTNPLYFGAAYPQMAVVQCRPM